MSAPQMARAVALAVKLWGWALPKPRQLAAQMRGAPLLPPRALGCHWRLLLSPFGLGALP